MSLFASSVTRAQDTLVVYSSVDEENAKKLLDAFSKATGVKVRFTFLSSGPAVARIEAEKNSHQGQHPLASSRARPLARLSTFQIEVPRRTTAITSRRRFSAACS